MGRCAVVFVRVYDNTESLNEKKSLGLRDGRVGSPVKCWAKPREEKVRSVTE